MEKNIVIPFWNLSFEQDLTNFISDLLPSRYLSLSIELVEFTTDDW